MRIVITGGSGVGKTEVVLELCRRGYLVVSETARFLLRTKYHNFATTTQDEQIQFQNELVKLQVKREKLFAKHKEPVFFDRSVIDVICYSQYLGVLEEVDVPHLEPNKYEIVFILDPLPDYEDDGLRWETKDQRDELHRLCYNIYKELGYQPVIVPSLSIADRVEYIIDYITNN